MINKSFTFEVYVHETYYVPIWNAVSWIKQKIM